MIKNDQYVGERDRYKDPFKEEVFTMAHPAGAPLELLERYGSRQEDQNILGYRGTAVPSKTHLRCAPPRGAGAQLNPSSLVSFTRFILLS